MQTEPPVSPRGDLFEGEPSDGVAAAAHDAGGGADGDAGTGVGGAGVIADLASLEEIERQLDDVDAALRHLDDGTYGICETCGTVIDEAVLVTSPVTRRCQRCAPPSAGTLFAPG